MIKPITKRRHATIVVVRQLEGTNLYDLGRRKGHLMTRSELDEMIAELGRHAPEVILFKSAPDEPFAT